MTRLCETCHHTYDDEQSWTICPHGPLWASPSAYCREHDMVNCKLHEPPPVITATRPGKLRTWFANRWWKVEHWIMNLLGFSWSIQDGRRRNKC